MKIPELSLEELTVFGIRPEDEGPHPFDPDEEWWNESWFWDFFDANGELAGHCRIGMLPAQRRAWLWFFLYRDGEWVAVEEPRLPLSEFQLPRLAYRGWGLEVSWDASEPLRCGHFRFRGFGRVLSGPRTGQVQAVGADLEVRALAAPHSTGRGAVTGHTSEAFDACRFEQPVALRGDLSIGDETFPFQGRGERDHSWGPRPFNMDWTFLVANGEELRFQCTDVRIPGLDPIKVGYLHREKTESLSDVNFDFTFDDGSPLAPVSGGFQIESEGGERLAFRLEAISGVEIDLTHTLIPPRRTTYRRVLVRVHPEAGGDALLGWCEFHRSA
jgi:hypothetical protein